MGSSAGGHLAAMVSTYYDEIDFEGADVSGVDFCFADLGKVKNLDKAKNLELAKAIPFSRTNDQLKEYTFPITSKGKDSMWQLLQTMLDCGLKNDALMDVFYEQMADGYAVDHESAVFVFHGVYDIPLKGKDKESQWESEEVYEFIVCTISPLKGEYEPDTPVWGFLYPAFSDRSADLDKINIFHGNPKQVEKGLMYKMFGEC